MTDSNPNSRLEAFSDGVFAIALTLLIIDVRLPSNVSIKSTAEFWGALLRITPLIFAFVLSFGIILITWVNHHNSFKLLNKSSSAFIYANGLLLLAVVVVPFPTALLGQYLLTEYAAPAVILYDSAIALLALGWIFMTHAALKYNLGKNDKAIAIIRQNSRYAFIAFPVYVLFAIIAIWYPLAVALVITVVWIFWLILGINIKHE